MIEQAFEVATEFRFDVGQAILNTKTLQGAVDQLSQSSQSALGSLNYLAGGLVAHLGFGSGGLLTVLSQAVKISEQFDQQSLGFANNISSNITVLSGTIDTFNDRLETSNMLMRNISQEAVKFGIDTSQLAVLTQKLATPLAVRGMLGKNYENAISMSRNLMLGSEFAGLHPQVASESLYRALTDKMPLHGALFARLVNTQAFKGAHIGTQGQLVGMNQDKKIELLSRALGQLAGDADALSHRLDTVRIQFQIMKDHVLIILKPLGDALKIAVVKVFKFVNEFLATNGKRIGESIGKLIGNIFEDPRALLINLMQLKNFGQDFKKALHLVELYGTFKFIRYILIELLGITFNGGLIRALFSSLYAGFLYVVALIPWAKIFSGAFTLLRVAIAEVLPIFLGFLFILQIISRARAIAKVNDIQAWLQLTPRIAEVMVRLKKAFENIMMPITMAIDFWSNLIAPLFQTSLYGKVAVNVLEVFASILEFLGLTVVLATAGLSGLVNVLIGFLYDMAHFSNPFKNAMKNFNEGVDSFLDRNKARLNGDVTNATANYVTNVGKIEARFDMREQLEPDRIAFAVTDHLKKLASNPQQARGSTVKAPFAGAKAFAVQ